MGRVVSIPTDIAKISFEADNSLIDSMANLSMNPDGFEIDLELEQFGRFYRYMSTPQNDSTIEVDRFTHGSPYENDDHPDWLVVKNSVAKLISTPDNRLRFRNNDSLELYSGKLVLGGSVYSPYPKILRAMEENITFDLRRVKPIVPSFKDCSLNSKLEAEVNSDQLTLFKLMEQGDSQKYIGYILFLADEHIANSEIQTSLAVK